MPVLIHAVLWWLLGLYLGGSGEPLRASLPLAVLVCLVAIAAGNMAGTSAASTQTPVRVAPWLLVAGVLAGHGARRERDRCADALHATLQRGDAVWAVFDEPSAPPTEPGAARRSVVRGAVRGAVSRGTASERARWGRCHVPLTVRWPRTAPSAGEALALRAVSLRTDRGLRLDHPEPTGARGPRDPWRAWRAHIAAVIDGHFGTRAPLVRALLIADQHGIAPDVRERYADAGLVHLLSVSGMHVAIIAGALLTLGSAARIPRRHMEPIAMALVILYVLLLGWPAPAVRSAVMLVVTTLSAKLQRPVHDWSALALGAAVPTVDPLVVHDLGWQLSVSGMAALVAARALKRDWRSTAHYRSQHGAVPVSRWRRVTHGLATARGIGGWMVSEGLTGLVAIVVTAPIIAWTFGRLSLVAPVANLVAGPIVGLLQPALFLALLWALVVPAPLAGWLPDATQPFMAALDRVAETAAAIPGAVMTVAPTLSTAVGTGLAAACVVRATAELHPRRRGRGHGRRWLVGAALACVGTLWWPLLAHALRRAPHGARFELHVLDVGQGDAVAMRTPRGRWILVDGGPRWQGGDAGRRTVVPYLRRHGGEAALFVMSHAHDDHVGGAASVMHALGVPRWWEPAFVATGPGYRAALETVRETGATWERVRPGRRWEMDGVTLTVLAPDSAWTVRQHNANETSVVLRVDYGRHRVLLTGDAEGDEEAWLLQHYPPEELAADVLKVGHHGSRTSTTPRFLDAVRPALGIASVGAGNRYGHPAPETLQSFLERHTPLLRTDREGTIIVRSDGRTLEVDSGGDRWIVSRPARVR
ncbi:DNA internalization-related competence protein ComEC/Rec2 [Gemmatimonas sp.]|uniref:DNA internalization-related competence protein ComEC/Rec2 n=1 Tax=Gemmatimonas sp. TaxID=1962908 RepID=UPI00391D5489